MSAIFTFSNGIIVNIRIIETPPCPPAGGGGEKGGAVGRPRLPGGESVPLFLSFTSDYTTFLEVFQTF